jgi:chromosome segregation ATPase
MDAQSSRPSDQSESTATRDLETETSRATSTLYHHQDEVRANAVSSIYTSVVALTENVEYYKVLVANLENANTELGHKNANLTEKVKALEDSSTDLTRENAEFTERVETHNYLVNDLDASNADLSRVVTELTEEAEQNKNIEEYRLYVFNHRIQELSNELNRLKTQQDLDKDLEQELNNCQAEKDDYRKEVKILNKRVTELKHQHRDEKQELLNKIKNLNTRMEGLKVQKEGQLQDFDAEMGEALDMISVLRESKIADEQVIERVQKENHDLLDRVKSLEKLDNKRQEEAFDLLDKNKNLNDENRELCDEIKTLTNSAKSLEEKVRDIQDENKNLSDENKQLCDENKALKNSAKQRPIGLGEPHSEGHITFDERRFIDEKIQEMLDHAAKMGLYVDGDDSDDSD